MRIERPQMWTLLRKQIDGPLMGLAVDAHVGDGVEPDLRGRLNGAKIGELEPAQEVLFDVADSRFDAPLLVAARYVAGGDGEAVVAGEVYVPRIEHRGDTGEALQNCRLQIVDHDLCGDAAKCRKRVLVAGKEMLHRLREGELDVHQPAVGRAR